MSNEIKNEEMKEITIDPKKRRTFSAEQTMLECPLKITCHSYLNPASRLRKHMRV